MVEAILSDIHSNLEALQAVLEDVEQHSVDRIICLGDVVGYGPSPAECVRIIMERCEFTLLGNHEFAVLHGPEGFNPIAETALTWTREQLRDRELLRFIQGLKSARLEDDRLYVHGSVRDPLLDYVREAESYLSFRRMVDEIRETFTIFNLCFTGHNHRAFLGTDEGFIFPHAGAHRFHVKGSKLYVCVGSVGQPRDEDWRACYTLFDGETVEYRRIPYDVEKTARRIREVGLHEFLAERLFVGH
jgi:diadenosine tetraphosphatase ApaH/serine/threonine PP2A family protein phosphatase